MMHAVGVALMTLSAVGVTASVVAYARVHWWRTPVGRHLMVYMAVMAVVIDLSLAQLVTGSHTAWFQWVRLVTFTLVPVVIWWRLALIIAAQRRKTTNERGVGER